MITVFLVFKEIQAQNLLLKGSYSRVKEEIRKRSFNDMS